MKRASALILMAFVAFVSGSAQTAADNSTFKLTLPAHLGQLLWHADGFKIVESSAKPDGREIGLRGSDRSGRLMFLGFLFLVPKETSLTSARCRDRTLDVEKKDNPTLKTLVSSELAGPYNLPIELVNYTVKGGDGKTWHMTRAFVATGDICGDLQFYSATPISAEDSDLKKILGSYQLDPGYAAQFQDIFLYAQVLYHHRMYKAAAPLFEQALAKLQDGKGNELMRRVVTDQAGMAYGMSGDIPRSRALFEAAIAKDPDYPLYYYNLACADTEEKRLVDAREHLKQAFDRKANVLPGETMPDPTKDESFLPYQGNKDFWAFIKALH